MNCQACKDLKWILFILAWNHLVAVRFLSTVFTVSAQRVNIVAEFDEQPVQFMIRGDLKNVECIIPLIHHIYRSFLRVVHLKSLLIFGSRLKRRVSFSLGLITQTSIMSTKFVATFWQLEDFSCSPRFFGETIHFDLRIFFQMGLVQPPTR